MTMSSTVCVFLNADIRISKANVFWDSLHNDSYVLFMGWKIWSADPSRDTITFMPFSCLLTLPYESPSANTLSAQYFTIYKPSVSTINWEAAESYYADCPKSFINMLKKNGKHFLGEHTVKISPCKEEFI